MNLRGLSFVKSPEPVRGLLDIGLKATTLSLLTATGFLTPLLFSPLFSEAYEFPKTLLLYIVISLLLFLLALRFLLTGVRLHLDSITLPLFLFIVAALISSLLSPSPQLTLFQGLPFFLAPLLLFFLLQQHLTAFAKEESPPRMSITHPVLLTLLAVAGSLALLALWRLLNFFELYLPLNLTAAQQRGFTPVGSSSSLNLLLAMGLPLILALSLWWSQQPGDRYQKTLTNLLFASVAVVTSALLLTATLWAGLLAFLGLGSVLAFIPPAILKAHRPKGLVLAGLLLTLGVLFYLPLRVNQPLTAKAATFPRGEQLDLQTGWVVAAKSLGDFPLLGAGVNSFPNNLSYYRTLEYNQKSYWNTRLSTSSNYFFHLLSTLGLLGTAAFLFLALRVLKIIKDSGLYQEKEKSDKQLLALGLTGALLTYLAGLLLTVPNLTTQVIFFLLLALTIPLLGIPKKTFSSAWLTAKNLDALPYLVLGPALLLTVMIIYLGGRLAYADYLYQRALTDQNKRSAATILNLLQKAIDLTPYRDSYHRSLSTVTFLLAKNLQSQGRPEDKDLATQLLATALQEAQKAVAVDLGNPENWGQLATLYRDAPNIDKNSFNLALAAYQQTINLDPANPLPRIYLGGLYYGRNDYDKALAAFSEAAFLKPDLANAHYNLAWTYRQKNLLPQAYAEMQKTLQLLSPTSADYAKALQDAAAFKQSEAASDSGGR